MQWFQPPEEHEEPFTQKSMQPTALRGTAMIRTGYCDWARMKVCQHRAAPSSLQCLAISLVGPNNIAPAIRSPSDATNMRPTVSLGELDVEMA